MDVYEAVMKRRSVRRFKDKPVPYDILEKCVDAGRLAPCARNDQLCEYIIVNDDQILPRVFVNTGRGPVKPPAQLGTLPENRPKAYIIILINGKLEAEVGARRRV